MRPRPILLAACLAAVALGPLSALAADPAPADNANPLVLEYTQVEAYARETSPRLRALVAAEDLAGAERDLALAWSNPALSYDLERQSEDREWQVALRQKVLNPLHAAKLSRAWDARLAAARLSDEQAGADFLASMRAEYIQLRLMDEHLGRLKALAEHVATADKIARDRYEAGDISGLEASLVGSSAYAVRAALRARTSEANLRQAAWRTAMGIPGSQALVLATAVGYRDCDPGAVSLAAADLALRPGHQATVALRNGLTAGAEAAGSWLPAVELHGGFKRFAGGEDGLVAGVALDLPVFDRGGAATGLALAESRVLGHRAAADLAARVAESEARSRDISAAKSDLAAFAARVTAGQDPMGALVESFGAGAVSLGDFLAAIQSEIGALEAYQDDLSAYYRNLAGLETLSGARLIRITSEEDPR